MLLFGYRPSNYSPCHGFPNLGIPSFFNKSQRHYHPSVFTRKMLIELLDEIGFKVLVSKIVNWKENIIIKVKK